MLAENNVTLDLLPAPGFQAALEQLSIEHLRELTALHTEIAQLKSTALEQPAVSNATTFGLSPVKGAAQDHVQPFKEVDTNADESTARPGSGMDTSVRPVESRAEPFIISLDEPAPPKEFSVRSSENRKASTPMKVSKSASFAEVAEVARDDDENDETWIGDFFGVGSEQTSLRRTGMTFVRDCPVFEAKKIWEDDRESYQGFGRGSEFVTKSSSVGHSRSGSISSSAFKSLSTMGSSEFWADSNKYPFIVGPASSTHGFWVCLTTSALGYDLCLIPMTLAFDLQPNLFFDIGNWITRIMWTIDIPMNFITGYYLNDTDILVLEPCKIAKRYVTSWFTLDAILVFVDWYLSMSGGDNKLSRVGRLGKFARFLRFLRMLRLLQAARFSAFFERLMEKIVDEAVRLRFITLKIVVVMLWLNHFLACIWYTVGSQEVNGNLGWADTFPALNSFPERYTASLQWSLTNFGVGSTRLSPSTTLENTFAFATSLGALLIFATLLSTIANGYARMQALKNDELVNMAQLRMYLAQNNISDEFSDRIIRQARRTVQLGKSNMRADSVVLLKQLTPRMNAELAFVVYEKHVSLNPLFSACLTMSKHLMFTLANEAMSTLHSPLGDVLFYRGQKATNVLLVPSEGFFGFMTYTGGVDGQSKELPAGRWICESCLWVHWVHLGSLRVSDACEQIQMSSEKFGTIVKDHPHVFSIVRDSCTRFVSSLNQALSRHTDDDANQKRQETLEMYDTHAFVDCRGTKISKYSGPKRRTTVRQFVSGAVRRISSGGGNSGESESVQIVGVGFDMDDHRASMVSEA